MPLIWPAGQDLRVLIIEDNLDGALTLRVLLSLAGHDVRVAHTGLEGVRVAQEWLPEIVLSDIGLPDLDGFGVARQLRQHPGTAHTRLIALTAYGSEEVRREANEAGYDYVLTKPADLTILEALLTAEP
jgi:CheY-like chemotaxis protein